MLTRAAVLMLAAVSLGLGGQGTDELRARVGAPQKSILFLSIDDFTRPYVRFMFEGFTDGAVAGSNPPAIFFESLDSSRFAEARYLETLREWLRSKYRERPIDLVIAMGEDVLSFLAATHGEPWPAAQVLYFESGGTSVDTRTLPHVGGMVIEDVFPQALQMIQKVLPQTSRVALVYGASAIEAVRWSGYRDRVRQANLEPIELVGLSMEETRAAVAALPGQTVAIILGPIVDAKGNVLSPGRVCELMAAAGAVPIITMETNHLGCGVVGGLLRDWAVIGRLLGQDALARLSSPSTDVMTVPVAKYTTIAFDDRQLQRWKIPERRLPAGALVQFREPNLWRDRRALVVSTLAVTILQSLLIAGLVLEHRRRRQAELDSRRNLAALAHLDRRAAMGELATSLAHELNQPLNAILQNAGVAQMLLASASVPPALDEMADIIGDIRNDDIRAGEMIRRMRQLLQKGELEALPLDLNDVVQDTVTILRPDARSRDIQLDLELAGGMPRIKGDRVHLQQVVLNLAMNALDAVANMPVERRRVRVLTSHDASEVRLTVVDTGAGVPADRQSKIFEPFYTTKSGSGMGMGLAISRSIVEAHRGRISAENDAGGGARVWFALPVAD